MSIKEIKARAIEYRMMVRILIQQEMDGLRLSFAIWMADALQRARNKRFYVMDNGTGRLIWLCNDDIKIMKKPRTIRKSVYNPKTGKRELVTKRVSLIPKDTTHTEIMRDCFYYTPANRNNEGAITPEERAAKRKRWIMYMEKYRMNRMFGKRKVVTRKKQND